VRCLKDHGHDANYITVKEVSILIKMINAVMLSRHGADQLEYAGFVQLIVQASIVAHKKGRVRDITTEQSNYLTHAQMVTNSLKIFKEFAQKKGENMTLYEVPEAMTSSGVIDEK
jgi:hypothetical protein